MPLQMLPVEPSDALRVVKMEDDAYSTHPQTHIFFPGPFPPDAMEARAAELVEELMSNPAARAWKVVDTDLSGDAALIGFAKWHIYEDAAPAPKVRQFGPGMNPEACVALFGGIAAMRARLMGEQPYVLLRQLHSDPKHQGRGAGRMLVEWGVEEAKRLGLPCVLEATPAGRKLYLRCGFRDVEELNIDMARFGGKGINTNWAMRHESSI